MRLITRPLVLAALCVAGPAAPALALDCAKAKTPIERAICADPAAQAADQAMTAAYGALAASLKPAHREALLISQRRWLERRDNLCAGENGGPDAGCLVRMAKERDALLAGAPQSGPGAPPPGLAPLFIQHVGRDREYDISVDALKFIAPGDPGERLFNERIDTLLKDVPPIHDPEIRKGQTYSHFLDVAVTFASDRFISARVELYAYTGGAHGMSSTSNIAVDLAAGREFRFSDMFDAAGTVSFEESCLAQIRAQKHEKTPDDTLDPEEIGEIKKTIAATVADLSNWSFFATRASVNFDAYAVGSYAEGAYSCEFPASGFATFLKFDYLPAR